MKTYSEMLLTGDVGDAEMQKEFYNTINQETDRLTFLIKNMLSLSRMEMGSLTIERSMVRTDWLLDDCMPAVEASAKEKRIAIKTELPDRFPVIQGDKELLKVVLVNIMGNAVKYTPEEGRITLSLTAADRVVLFRVADTGCGIPSKDLPRLFDKFYRGESPEVRKQTGSGLGLSTASQIVKLHGGSIEVESEPGKGSTFTVKLPEEEFSLEHQ
jgi:signal transduction histidine kinase